jgi:hypothetical protein
MLRILLFILLLWLLYVVLKRFIAFNTPNETSRKPSSSEKIIACKQCGLHIPESEARIIGSSVYCNNPDCHPK